MNGNTKGQVDRHNKTKAKMTNWSEETYERSLSKKVGILLLALHLKYPILLLGIKERSEHARA